MNPREQAVAAREAARALGAVGTAGRVAALHRMADALVARAPEILAANALDVADARTEVEAGRMSSAMAKRLGLSLERLAELAAGLRDLAALEEPIGRVLRVTELAEGLMLRQVTSPLGVLLVIFESRPDALPQIAGLALRAGDGLLLKGGKEAARSNEVLHRVLTDALEPEIPRAVIGLVTTREAIDDLLALHDVIDLVIPRGSNALVSSIQARTRIPVLGHADGVCHVYVDAAADLAMACAIVADAKKDYPAACNALETLLVHRALAADGRLATLLQALSGVKLFAHPDQAEELSLPAAKDLHMEYGDLAATVVLVRGVQEAIDHIHRHGSAHTDAIVTEDAAVAERFLQGVDSAAVFWNASTRFCDGYRFGLGAEVGISTSRLHARGPVGVEGLLTTRWLLEGHGQTVGQTRSGEVRFTHRHLVP